MTLRARLLLAAFVVAAIALAMTRGSQAPAPPPVAAGHASVRAARVGSPAAPVDPEGIRDVFRFAERPPEAATRSAPRPALTVAAPTTPDLPKLVGLVRRQGRLLAAFSKDGEVLLAGPGESAAGVTVLEVSEEGVLVRRKDGGEERLRLP